MTMRTTKIKPVRGCEDCGDTAQKRRTSCPCCGKKVCRFCYHHYHNKPETRTLLAQAKGAKAQKGKKP